jgi:hypothetical protein
MDKLTVDHSFVNQIATTLSRHGWETPALVLLEAGKPLTFLGGQLLWVVQPALSLVMPTDLVRQTAQLLEEPEAVEALISQLETAEANKK